MRYAGKIKRGAKLKSKSGQSYETLEDADFSKVDTANSNFTLVAETDAQTGRPKTFALKLSNISYQAGETKTTSFTVGNYRPFTKLIISDTDVIEVIRVNDSEGNLWYEVDFLAQDTIFDSSPNVGQNSTDVPYVLKLRSVPYRFKTDYNFATGETSLIFGSGDAQSFDGELIPDLGDLSLPAFGRDTFTDFSIDPQNFLKTRTLGLAPVNTLLTVKYRTGGGALTNAGAGEIDAVSEKIFDVSDSSLDTATIRDVANSFSVLNTTPAQGGKDELNAEEIRQLIPVIYASQSRVVTAPDFIARTLSMPSKFGSVFRANAKLNALNKNSIELIVLSRDVDGYVSTAPQELKENLKRYLSRFRMMTDAIEILDGEVINIALKFEILTNPDFAKTEVLANCIDSLKEYFEITTWQINQPINRTDIYTLIAKVPGVLSLIDFNIINRVGNFDSRSYSTTTYNIAENTKNGIIYCKENAIFECKFLNKDIFGTAK